MLKILLIYTNEKKNNKEKQRENERMRELIKSNEQKSTVINCHGLKSGLQNISMFDKMILWLAHTAHNTDSQPAENKQSNHFRKIGLQSY